MFLKESSGNCLARAWFGSKLTEVSHGFVSPESASPKGSLSGSDSPGGVRGWLLMVGTSDPGEFGPDCLSESGLLGLPIDGPSTGFGSSAGAWYGFVDIPSSGCPPKLGPELLPGDVP